MCFHQRADFDSQLSVRTAEPDRFGIVAIEPDAVGDSAGSRSDMDLVTAQGLGGVAARPQPDRKRFQIHGLAVMVEGAMDDP